MSNPINNANHGNNGSCSICMSNYEAEEQRGVLNCDHIFHRDCLVDMRRVSAANVANSCPLCRTRITSINGEPVEPILPPRRNEVQIHEDGVLALQLQNQFQMDFQPPGALDPGLDIPRMIRIALDSIRPLDPALLAAVRAPIRYDISPEILAGILANPQYRFEDIGMAVENIGV